MPSPQHAISTLHAPQNADYNNEIWFRSVALVAFPKERKKVVQAKPGTSVDSPRRNKTAITAAHVAEDERRGAPELYAERRV